MSETVTPHILCTWELGGQLGHISQLSRICRRLHQRGYSTSVALKDLSQSSSFFDPTETRLFQAPVWGPKINMQRPIACLPDVMLLSGFLKPEELMGMVAAWRSLYASLQPDALVFDYSPTAMLAALDLNIPKIMVGSGFSEPQAGHPITDWRPYATNDGLAPRQEAMVLERANSVLSSLGIAPLEQLSELFRVNHTVIYTAPELDLYHEVREQTSYHCPGFTTPSHPKARFGPAPGPKILAYLKPGYPDLDAILRTLAQHSANVFVACPRGDEARLKPLQSDSFRYSTEIIALADSMKDADLFLGHGNAGSTMESLLKGIPSLVLPIQLEQLLTGLRLETMGTGKLIRRFESEAAFIQHLDEALEDKNLHTKAQAFACSNPTLTDPPQEEAVARKLDELLGLKP